MTINLSEVDRLNIKIRRLSRKNDKLKKQKEFYKTSLDNYIYILNMHPSIQRTYTFWQQTKQLNERIREQSNMIIELNKRIEEQSNFIKLLQASKS